MCISLVPSRSIQPRFYDKTCSKGKWAAPVQERGKHKEECLGAECMHSRSTFSKCLQRGAPKSFAILQSKSKTIFSSFNSCYCGIQPL